jgi:hypothetical protein
MEYYGGWEVRISSKDLQMRGTWGKTGQAGEGPTQPGSEMLLKETERSSASLEHTYGKTMTVNLLTRSATKD